MEQWRKAKILCNSEVKLIVGGVSWDIMQYTVEEKAGIFCNSGENLGSMKYSEKML